MDQFHEQQDDEKPIWHSKLRASEDEKQFRLIVKIGNTVLLDFEGHPKNNRAVTLADLKAAVDAEATIEKLVGVRVHILQVVE